MVKTAYRGSKKEFGLSIENARFNALYFTKDYNFAKMFGSVKTYRLKPTKTLDLRITSVRLYVFGKISKNLTSIENLETIYINGDFPYIQTDDLGFGYSLLNLIIEYALENKYDMIKMTEFFSSKIKPVIYIVLSEKIVNEL